MDLHDPYMVPHTIWIFMRWNRWLDYLSNQIQILKKLSLWLKKNVDLYDPHMVFYRIS